MGSATGIVGEFQSLKAEIDADLLAMQCGDFYEFFGDDATVVGEELDLRVSQKTSGGTAYPMAGVPVDDLTPYLKSLVERGYRVAVADQFETADGFAREIDRVVTPGTLLERSDAAATYIASVVHNFKTQRFGLAFADVTTGRFHVTSIAGEDAQNRVLTELYRFDPVEILPGPTIRDDSRIIDSITDRLSGGITHHDEKSFGAGAARHRIRDHFGRETLEALGFDRTADVEVMAAGAILSYVDGTGVGVLQSMTRLQRYRREDHAVLDATTQRNLELTESMTGEDDATVFETIDCTTTAGGSRRLREWLQRPMRSRSEIERRQESVSGLVETPLVRERLQELLAKSYDLERLSSRVSSGRSGPQALLQVRDTLGLLPDVVDIITADPRVTDTPLSEHIEEIDTEPLLRLESELADALREDPPKALKEGGLLKTGYDEELDDLVSRHESALEWIETLEDRLKGRLDITHLRVDRNRTDGYYIQIGRSELDRVPDEWSQLKELKNSVRFSTEELKDREREILHLEEQRGDLEYELFTSLRSKVSEQVPILQETGRVLARIDAIASLADHSAEHRWSRPELVENGTIAIDGGRHPVVERTVDFVPNDVSLDDDRSFLIVTGPNMSGKSTYLRQVALIVLLAQIGSYVPANGATIGIVDGIYTRVGALDELAKGRSTFMVEMQELSNILHSATEDSLVILDEVGRGTATYDGISIAWAATEYIHNEIRSKTLFATHYHELTVLADHLDRLENVHVAVDERDGEVTFLRSIRKGATDRSYGVHVADLAGVPDPVVDRARVVLDRLRREKAIEARGSDGTETTQVVFDVAGGRLHHPDATADGGQTGPPLDPDTEAVLDSIRETDLPNLSPIEVMTRVQDWQNRLENAGEHR